METKALIPIFLVSDVPTAVRYYTEVLGFTESFRSGTYSGLKLGKYELHLTDPGEPRHVIGAGTAYVICDEIEAYFQQIKAGGAKLNPNRPTGCTACAISPSSIRMETSSRLVRTTNTIDALNR